MKVFSLISSVGLLLSAPAMAAGLSLGSTSISSSSVVSSVGAMNTVSNNALTSASLSSSASLSTSSAVTSLFGDKISAADRAIMRAKVNPNRTASSSSNSSLVNCKFCTTEIVKSNASLTPSINVQTAPAVLKPGVINSNPVVSGGALKSVAAIR